MPVEEVLRKYRDWRYAPAVGLAGTVVPAVLHLLPPPLHVEFNWGVPPGWGTGALIWRLLARRGGREQRGRLGAGRLELRLHLSSCAIPSNDIGVRGFWRHLPRQACGHKRGDTF